jgi:hypothetical protein
MENNNKDITISIENYRINRDSGEEEVILLLSCGYTMPTVNCIKLQLNRKWIIKKAKESNSNNDIKLLLLNASERTNEALSVLFKNINKAKVKYSSLSKLEKKVETTMINMLKNKSLSGSIYG